MTVAGQASSQPRVAVIGAGNVAVHLAEALAQAGCLAGVWSREESHALTVAAPLNVPGGAMSALPRDLDIYIVAVKDDAIPAVSATIGSVAGIVAHTSGTAPMDALIQARRGVFYPLQTFSRNRPVDMSEVPFFIEGSDAHVSETLMDLAKRIVPMYAMPGPTFARPCTLPQSLRAILPIIRGLSPKTSSDERPGARSKSLRRCCARHSPRLWNAVPEPRRPGRRLVETFTPSRNICSVSMELKQTYIKLCRKIL